ncbi:MAG: GNAT family N-acetyltransferase [Bacteroidetes bacterium]|jgi:hypothetical protein|nr:GNAT family N-acetyltransferase [Bacteroidota bacterium]MBT6835825.1 GNAT family N-acetyltransferase [Bacteroidota bacterium]MBT7041022.1 GNAT family N-acetyltransferase [Bacteroidota bacterium]
MIVTETKWRYINRDKWDELITKSGNSSIYNTWGWIQTITEAYDNEIIVIIEEKENAYHSVLPLALTSTPFIGKRYISFPFSDHFPIIFSPSSNYKLVIDYVLNNLNKSIQIRDEIKDIEKMFVGFYHTLNLSNNPEVVFQRFNKKQIQQRIRNLDYQKLTIESGTTEYFTSNLYSLLLSSRTRLNSFLPSKKYFRSLYNNLLKQNNGYISLVKFEEKIIAGGLFLKHNKTIYFKHGASLNKYWGQHPNHFLIWEMIKRSCDAHYEYFDFGRTGLGNEGLRKFKLNWGSEEKELFYSLINGPSSEQINKAIKMRKYMSLAGKYFPGYSRLFNHKFYKYFP